MKILLISESSTEDDIYRMIDQIIKIDKIIEEEVENYIMEEIICGNSSISVREFSGE